MNILWLSWRGPGHPLSGGAEQVSFKHMIAWKKAGHKITLFTSHFKDAKHHETIEGIEVFRYGDQFFGVKAHAAFWYLRNLKKVDLVVDEHHGIPFFTPLYVHKPKLVFVHEVASKVWALNPWPWPMNIVPALLGSTIEKYILKSFYTSIPFFTVSDSTYKELSKIGIKDISVIHNGVTLPEKIPHTSKFNEPTFIFLSALAKDKGVEEVISAYKLIYNSLTTSKLLIVGKGHPGYVEELKQKSDGLPIEFLGYVSEEKKFELLSKSHILLFPSAHEGWGLVVIEANSVGTPAVVYPSAGLVDSTVDGVTGIITKQTTPESLAESTIKLINNKKYPQISSQAKEWSKKYSWEKSTRESTSLLSKIFKQSNK